MGELFEITRKVIWALRILLVEVFENEAGGVRVMVKDCVRKVASGQDKYLMIVFFSLSLSVLLEIVLVLVIVMAKLHKIYKKYEEEKKLQRINHSTLILFTDDSRRPTTV